MNFKYGKLVALGLVLLTIAGCSKERPLMDQAEVDQNKRNADHMKDSQKR